MGNLFYSYSVDLWTVGVIILEMLTGCIPFHGSTEFEQLLFIFKSRGTPTEQNLRSYEKYKVMHMVGLNSPKLPSGKPCDFGFVIAELLDQLLRLDP